MKNSLKITAILTVLLAIVSCQSNERKPGYQYMPNMYESVPYDTYGEYEIFEPVTGGSEAMKPAEGSVMRGWLPYEIDDNREGYDFAKANLTNPIPYTEENFEKGKALYDIYCAICHGSKGNGQGTLVEREKILGVPAYNDAGRAITAGSVYHVMYYGINSMGSYASQMSEKELWQVDHYVMSLKAKLDGEEPAAFVEEVQVAETAAMQDMDAGEAQEGIDHQEEAHSTDH
ncbi:MAG: cytochrome c [Dokdonia sp.]|jgi:mono/diheme cytochrome c family protein|nr:cytochrome C [Cytophagaceae bacterium]